MGSIGDLLGPLGTLLDPLGTLLDPLWCILRVSWGSLGTLWVCFGAQSGPVGRSLEILCVFLKHFERMLVIFRSITCSTIVSGSCFVVVRGFVALCETVLQHASKLSQSERACRSLAKTSFF